MNLQHEEAYFQQLQQQYGELGDPIIFQKIYSLIEQIRQLREQNDRLTVLNRHYYHTFYNGNIDKMIEDFKYLME